MGILCKIFRHNWVYHEKDQCHVENNGPLVVYYKFRQCSRCKRVEESGTKIWSSLHSKLKTDWNQVDESVLTAEKI